jgi:hypothetical protein
MSGWLYLPKDECLPREDSSRQTEILSFMEEHRINKFCAIDDEPYNFPTSPSWLFLTDDSSGLDRKITQRVIDFLVKPSQLDI